MGCTHSKLLRKRRKKSTFQECSFIEQNESHREFQRQRPDRENFSKRKQEFATEDGFTHINPTSQLKIQDGEGDLMTSIGFRENNSSHVRLMRNLVLVEFPRRRREMEFRRRKLCAMYILAMTAFVHCMGVRPAGINTTLLLLGYVVFLGVWRRPQNYVLA
ncbi:uncharacterized protein LOC132544845 [Ylistrum balloti]|uniref:uncharacterized protein LOC132544845 n=1 Tax=Ylistrum balloti TaxID=509963 RepID=UPI0029059C1A|nr:uncharacterized protein LOC132544845 [Ylistrum balloti]